jgi:hypothetical protein
VFPTEGGGQIFLTRIDAAGAVMDPNGLLVGPGATPTVVWEGTSFLVVYSFANQVLGRRLKADGTFVDTSPFVIAEVPNQIYGSAAWNNGSKTFVTWSVQTTSPGAFDIYGTRVVGSSVVDAAPGISVAKSAHDKLKVTAAFAGGNWLVVWEDNRLGEIFGARVEDATGTVLDAAGILLGPGGNPAVASDGTNFLVVRGGNTATRVASATGAISSLTVANLNASVSPTVAFAGGVYQVVWPGGSSGLWGNRVPPTGDPLDGTGVRLDGGRVTDTAAAAAVFSAGTSFYVAWSKYLTSANTYLRGSRFSIMGGVLDAPGVDLTRTANRQYLADIASDGANRWFVIWADDRDGAFTLLGARIDASGHSLDPCGIPLAQNTSMSAVARSGSRYLVSWQQSDGRLKGVRVETATGKVLDAVPLSLYTLPINKSYSLSGDDTHWFVTWASEGAPPLSSSSSNVYGGRIGTDGSVVDGTGKLLWSIKTPYLGANPKVAFGGGVFLVVGQDPTTLKLIATRVDPTSGAPLDSPPINLVGLGMAGNAGSYGLGFGPTRFTVARSNQALTLSPSDGAISPVSSALDPDALPGSLSHLAFDGTATLIAYEGTASGAPKGIHGSRFLDGVDLDPSDFDLTDFPVAEPATNYLHGILAAGIPGKFLVAYNRYDPTPGITNIRIETRVVESCGDGGCSAADGGSVDLAPVSTDGGADGSASACTAIYGSDDGGVLDALGSGDAATDPTASERGDAPVEASDGAADAYDAAIGASDARTTPDADEDARPDVDSGVLSDGATQAGDAAVDESVDEVPPASTDGGDADATISDGRDARDGAKDMATGTSGGGCSCDSSGGGSGSAWLGVAFAVLALATRVRSIRSAAAARSRQ